MNVLAFFAHPDDETMFLGGTLAHLARTGAQVYYVSATRGEGGELGEPPLCSREDLGSVREREMRCAVRALGGEGVDFLDYIDPEIGPENELYPFTTDLEELTDQLLQRLIDLEPEVVLTHGPRGEYGHPAHILAHRGMVGAVRRLPSPHPELYAVFRERDQGDLEPGETPLQPDFILDVSSTLEEKIQAALCHRTQHALFRRNASRRAGREVSVAEMIRDREGLVRIAREGGEEDGSRLFRLVDEIALD